MSDTLLRWFQVHLSTAVVLMFVAGGVIWANVRGRTVFEADDTGERYAKMAFVNYGWPIEAIGRNYDAEYFFDSNETLQQHPRVWGPFRAAFNPETGNEADWKIALTIDVAFAILIMLFITFLVERFLRRGAKS